MMKEIGIMFSAPMILAVADGRKTQTRRLASSPLARLKPGTRVWTREAFRLPACWDDTKPSLVPNNAPVRWEADQHGRNWRHAAGTLLPVWGNLRPSIHQPRAFARVRLLLESVRVEPLQAISWQDAVAEGIESRPYTSKQTQWRDYSGSERHFTCAAKSYRSLWESLHTKPGERWEDNPKVVVLTFSRAWRDQ